MRKNKFFIWLLVIAAMIGLTACQKVSCKVEFNTNEGSIVESIDVFKNGKITAPADPTKDGYVFGGWYLDAECTQEVQLDTYKVQGDITLYAKWVANEYTVTFNLNGGTGAADPQKVKHGERITLPTGLTKEGCKFKAWYKDSALTIPFIPTAGVTSDLTLYAKWESLLTFSGTNAGNATYNPEDGTYTFKTTLGLYGRFNVAYNGALLSADPEGDLIITGAFSSENQAGWDENLYCDIPDGAEAGTPIDYTTFICSSSRSVDYTVTYDPATNTLDIQAEFVPDVYEVSEEGLFFLIRDNNRLLSSYGDATLNDDGSYSTTIELSQWWRVYLYFDAAEIDVNGEAADIKGDFGTWAGRDNPKSLYFDLENDGPCAFISSYDGAVEYKITYYPATDSAKAYVIIDADPETEPYDPSQEGVIKTEFTVDAASDSALAVWTEAGTIFRDTETSSWGPLANGWRLITIVDENGKIVYSVLNIGNGFGSVGEEGASYYAHPDYATNNPAYTATDAGWKLTLPEGCFAITGHGEKALDLILALTGDEYPDSDTAQVVINKMDAIDESARIAYDATAGTVKVSGVNYDEEEESPIPATGLFFEYSYGAEGTDIAYADAEAIVDNGDGTYSFVVELAAWRYVRLYWNGEVLDTATNLTLESKANIYIGTDNPTDRLYTNANGEFEFVFTPATDSANAKVVAGPYVPPVEDGPVTIEVAAAQDAELAVWTEAGLIFRDSAANTNGPLGNAWRLIAIVDADGKLVYFVLNIGNGYGSVGEDGPMYYAHPDYATNNPARVVSDAGWQLVLPEGCVAVTGHSGKALQLILALTGNTYPDSDTAQGAVNNMNSIPASKRISYDATAGTITVSEVEDEEVPSNPNVPATGLFFEYSYGAEGTDIAYADAEAIVDNGDGTYSFVVELAAWRYVRLYWNGKVLDTATNLTLESKGNIYIGSAPDPTDRLFTNANGEFEFVFTPATDSANAKVVAGPYVPPVVEETVTIEVAAAQDAELAVWTEAGLIFRDSAANTNGPLGNAWRLIAIVDADGKLVYFVLNIGNGYGSVGEYGPMYYAHPDYATNNPARVVSDAGWQLVLPEGCVAVTGHSGKALQLILALTGNTYPDSDTAQGAVNNMNSIPASKRISYDATAGTITVSDDKDSTELAISYTHSALGTVEWLANEEGKYEVTLDFALWGNIKVSVNGALLTDADVTGDFRVGAGNGDTLYVDNAGESSFFCNKASKFKLTYDVETGKLNVEHIEFLA